MCFDYSPCLLFFVLFLENVFIFLVLILFFVFAVGALSFVLAKYVIVGLYWLCCLSLILFLF